MAYSKNRRLADLISSAGEVGAYVNASIVPDDLHSTLDLTGKTITVATASASDNDTTVASTAFVQQEIASLVDSAPGTLNTLNELAAALGDDANYATTTTNSIALKAPLASPTFTGTATVPAVNISAGTPVLTLTDTSSSATTTITLDGVDTTIDSNGTNGDIRFKGNDGGSEIVAMVMDMSEGGSVGIGTASPAARLDIRGGGLATDPSLSLVSDTSGAYNHSINALNPNLTAGEANIIVVGSAGSTNNAGYLGFKYAGDGSNNNLISLGHWGNNFQLNVTGDGKVGIGTESPTTKLQIMAASDEEDVILLEDNGGTDVGAIRIHGGAFMMKGKSATAPVQMQTHDGNEDIEVDPDGFIKMETAGSERLRIDSSGNLLLGMTSGHHAAANRTVFEMKGTSSAIIGMDIGGSYSTYMYDSGQSGQLEINHPASIYLNADTNLRFATGANVVAMTIDDDGYQTNINCRFQAKRSGSGNQGSTVHVVVFDSEDFDVGGNYNTSNGNFTAPVTGHYFFYYHHMNHQSSGNYGTIYLDLNGSTYHYTHTVATHPAGTTLSVIVPMTAGNTVRIRANEYYYNASYRHALFGGYLVG